LGYQRPAADGAPAPAAAPAAAPVDPGLSAASADPGLRAAPADVVLDEALVTALKELAARHGCTLFMVLHAALSALLASVGAGQDILIGTAVDGRADPRLAGTLGFFANTIALRADVSGDPAFSELLRRVRAFDLSALDHAHVPFQHVVD